MLRDGQGRLHRYLRISVTDRCNLRCLYCMPQCGMNWKPKEEILNYEEIRLLTEIFAHLGVSKVRITGGEPLLRQNLPLLIHMISQINGIHHIGLTTNGILLSRQADDLKEAGLNSVNLSLDTLKPDRYAQITGLPLFSEVIKGLESAIRVGFTPLKINCVVIKGFNDDEVEDFIDWVRYLPIEVRFIEFMPFGGTIWQADRVVSGEELIRRLARQYPLKPENQDVGKDLPPSNSRSLYSQVARTYTIEGFQGKIGFINPLSAHFCGTCDRIRLTADGSIKTCLFSPPELNLRASLRTGVKRETLIHLICQALQQKPQSHPLGDKLEPTMALTMTDIGG